MRIDLPFGFIRPWEGKDLPVLLHCLQQERIRKNLRSPSSYSTALAKSPTHFALVANDKTIGGIGFDLDLPHSRAHLGFWLEESFSGQQIMSTSLPSLCGWFQSEHPELIIQSTVYGWNPISQKLLDKVGFSQVARLHNAIHYSDEVTDLLIYEWDSLSQTLWKQNTQKL
jgi:RimJ/RimL family protein N-acetyltransferase